LTDSFDRRFEGGDSQPQAALTRRFNWMWIWLTVGTFAVLAAVMVFTPIGETAYVIALNQVETTEFEVRGDELWMNGEINSRTHKQFTEIMNENPQITTLVEEVIPGSLDDDTMIEMAYDVRRRGLNTRLVANSAIDSGGVDLFLAGVQRTMAAGAHIGVHSWSNGLRDGAEYPPDAPEHQRNRTYVEDMLGSDDFYWFTIYAAPSDGIHSMTGQEIHKYGLLTAPIE